MGQTNDVPLKNPKTQQKQIKRQTLAIDSLNKALFERNAIFHRYPNVLNKLLVIKKPIYEQ